MIQTVQSVLARAQIDLLQLSDAWLGNLIVRLSQALIIATLKEISIITRGWKNNQFFDALRFSLERFSLNKLINKKKRSYLHCVLLANLICLDTIAIQPTQSMQATSQLFL